MKFRDKTILTEPKESKIFSKAREELSEYKFGGYVDFMTGPTGMFNFTHNIVIPEDCYDDNVVLVDNKEVSALKVNGSTTDFIQVSNYPLSKNKTLQAFLDLNKNAKCIVFYVTGGGSIFHEGNVIRPYTVK